MEIALRFLRYSEKITRAYSAIAQNSTLWKSTLRTTTHLLFNHINYGTRTKTLKGSIGRFKQVAVL